MRAAPARGGGPLSGAGQGGIGERITAYVAFKRATGKKFDQGEYYLRRFERYCVGEGFDTLTREAAEGFVEDTDSARGERPDRRWVSYLRGLGLWMRAGGDHDAHVLSQGFYPKRPRPETYLLGGEQVEAFFGAAAAFDNGPEPWGWQAKAFFGLMCACGLRTGEARKLDRADVDLAAGTILVRSSKGLRSRLLPASGEVMAMLEACDWRNERFRPGRDAFFTTTRSGRVGAGVAADMFRRVWDQAALAWPASAPFPKPYSFRHRFAYANIERWARSGPDPAAMMPYLGRYMGHASPESTLYYLHVSPDYLRERATGVSGSAALLPEVGFDG